VKPMLKAPKTKRLKLRKNESLSIVAFKFNLRRHTAAQRHHQNTALQNLTVCRCRLTTG